MKRSYQGIAWLLAAGMVSACGSRAVQVDEESAESVASQLEQENGGFSIDYDEVPAFGLGELDQLPLELAELGWDLIPEDLTDQYLDSMDDGSNAAGAPAPDSAGANGAPGGGSPPPGGKPGDSTTDPAKKPAPCPKGFIVGKWKEAGVVLIGGKKIAVGVFKGKIGDDKGQIVAHAKGVYGAGKFLGKVIDLGGKPLGLLAGLYKNGKFSGKIVDKGGVKARLHGVYADHKLKGKVKKICKEQCLVLCIEGFVPDPAGGCFCVPVPECKPGSCPEGMWCDLCPPGCPPPPPAPPPAPNAAGGANNSAGTPNSGGSNGAPSNGGAPQPGASGGSNGSPPPCVAAVCGKPVCVPLPPPPPKTQPGAPSQGNSAGGTPK
jgi:hypothetical protein